MTLTVNGKNITELVGSMTLDSNVDTLAVLNQNADKIDTVIEALQTGKADLINGKVPVEQLPRMDFDPVGAAEEVFGALTEHIQDTDNPHEVTAEQINAVPITRTVNGKVLSANITLGAGDVGTHTKEEVASASTKALYGLPSTATPNEVLTALAITINAGWQKIFSKETAGAFSWTVPDLFGDGLPYIIGVLIIGGGGSGQARSIRYRGNPLSDGCRGGYSGHSKSYTMMVTPGLSYDGVVGAGGASATCAAADGAYAPGNKGGSSSFAGVVVGGGSGGNPFVMGEGGQVPDGAIGLFGGVLVPGENNVIRNQYPLSCYNLFENKQILGSGGGASVSRTASPNDVTTGTVNPGGKDPVTGLGGGDGSAGDVATVGNPADAPGCGGGGVVIIAQPGTLATSGAGAAGAVYIYIRGKLA